ncbi:MAG: tyrosine-type recombinase/integrase [Sulfitobacter pontiacus]|uniref:tyrosine-type recombinase/integrase n=1 Tax=Sulfitobacter pontiacus TaxID=60137 RepID=UPI003299B6D9
MNKRKTISQREALELLYQAHDMVRGPLRTAIGSAIEVGEQGGGIDLNNLTYDQLRGGQKLTDPKRPGLVMRHGKQRGRYWIFRTTEPQTKHQIEVPMGNYPAIGIAEARSMWRQLRDQRKDANGPFTEIVDGKARPIPADRLLGNDSVGKTMRMRDLVRRYIEGYANKVKRSADVDERLLERHIVPILGDKPVDKIGPKDITQIVHTLHDRAPREAEKLMACLSTMFNVAKGKTRKIKMSVPWLSDEIANPMALVPPLPTRKVQAYKPSVEEMRRYYDSLDELGDLYTDALRLQVLTTTRISEAVDLPWSEIDLSAGRWVLPAKRSKNKTEHVILLPTQALDILKHRRASDPEGAWVFPSPKYPDEHASSDTVSKIISANRDTLGIDPRFVSHSVRHAATTWLAENLVSIEVRDRVLNHLPPSTRVDSMYNGAALNQPASLAWQRWSDAVTEAEITDNVTSIEGARA